MCLVLEREYRITKNKALNLAIKLKKNYMDNLCDNIGDQPKSVWEGINTFLYNAPRKEPFTVQYIEANNICYEEPEEIASCFNSFF